VYTSLLHHTHAYDMHMHAHTFRVEVQPEPDRTLEQRQDEEAQEMPYMLDLLAQSCYEHRASKQPLPFSNKCSMFSARHPVSMTV